MAKVRCEIIDLPEDELRHQTVAVRSAQGRRELIGVPAHFVKGNGSVDGPHYLSVSVVGHDNARKVVLIEFPYEADSGAWRAWVPLASLASPDEVAT